MKTCHALVEYLQRRVWSEISVPHNERIVDILLRLVDDNHRAVNRTVSVVTPLEFFIVLSIQFITPTLFWSSTIIRC